MSTITRRLKVVGIAIAVMAFGLSAASAGAEVPTSSGTLTVQIAAYPGGGGTVTGVGGIDCTGPPEAGTCSAYFSPPPWVQGFLIATPGPGSVFAGWSGLQLNMIPEDNCNGLINPCMVWLHGMGDRTVTAHFAPRVPTGGEECTSGRYIVVFDDLAEDPEALADQQVAHHGGTLGHVYRHGDHAPPTMPRAYYTVAGLSVEAVAELRGDPNVDYIMPADHAAVMFQGTPADEVPSPCSSPEDEYVCAIEPWLCGNGEQSDEGATVGDGRAGTPAVGRSPSPSPGDLAISPVMKSDRVGASLLRLARKLRCAPKQVGLGNRRALRRCVHLRRQARKRQVRKHVLGQRAAKRAQRQRAARRAAIRRANRT